MPRRHLPVVLALGLGILVCRAPAADAPPGVEATPPSAAAPEDLGRLADAVAKEVEALRGWTFTHPVEKRFCSPEDVRTYLAGEIDGQCPPERVRQIEAFLRTVGLLPAGCDLKATLLDLLEEQVGGYYDSDAKALFLVTRGEALPAFVLRIMIAHELTHALDDQHVGIGGFIKAMIGKSEDLDLVAMSVTEGSATSLMTQYMVRAQLAGSADLAELHQYALREAQRSENFLRAPRYFTVLVGTYLCGMNFLARGNPVAAMLGDNKAIGENLRAAVKDPPESTEQVLHPEKYWDPAARDAPVLVDDAAVRKMLEGPGRWVVHANTVGEMLCALLAAPPDEKVNLLGMPMASAWTNEGAAGWGGDRFFLVASGANADEAARTLRDARGLWITLWDSPRDRQEFAEAYERRPAGGARTIVPLGTLGAVVLFGFEEAEARALAERLQQSPPPFTRAGKPWTPWAL